MKLTKAHKATQVSEPGLLDRVVCACGWQSSTYYDGREYADAEHRLHLKRVEALSQNQEQSDASS